MKNFPEMLDRYMVAKGYRSNSEMAEALDVSRQYMHRVRTMGKASDELCIEIGRTIGEHPAAVMVARNALLESGEKREIWNDFLERLAAMTAIKDYRKYLFTFQINGLRTAVTSNCQH